MKQLYSKHFGRAVVYTLLALFLCVAGMGKAAASNIVCKPYSEIVNTTYTNTGTEVTLRLWMYNFAGGTSHYGSQTIDLVIDGASTLYLQHVWPDINTNDKQKLLDQATEGNIGTATNLKFLRGEIGTLQLCNLQNYQNCKNDPNTLTSNQWSTIDLKFSFNELFNYSGHTIGVRGSWYDNSNNTPALETMMLQNIISGFVYPSDLKADFSDDNNVVFSWKKNSQYESASTDGRWIVYRIYNQEGNKNYEQIGESPANTLSLSVDKKKFSCNAQYTVSFVPSVCDGEKPINGLYPLFTYNSNGHNPNANDVCQKCGHSFFRYHTTDGSLMEIKKHSAKNFGANIVAHSVINGECVIEFDGQITQIPENPFIGKEKFTGDLRIPNSVTKIGVNAFSASYFNGTLTLPSNLKIIEKSAFTNCFGFTGTLTLPNSVTSIGSNAFRGCSGFTGTLTLPNSVTSIGTEAFRACSKFTSLKLSDSLSVISKHAFYDCEGLSGDLVIPNSVTKIGDYAFYNCNGFNGTLTLPNNLESIGKNAFYVCSGFKGALTLPNSVTTIGESAFSGCSGFTSLKLSESLSSIPDYAFNNCQNLTNELVIPASVERIGRNAFLGCINLNKNSETPLQVTLPKTLKYFDWEVFVGCNYIKTVKYQSLPEDYSNNDKTKTVSLSDGSYIRDNASDYVNAISYTRKMSSDWGTLVLPYSLNLTGDEPYRLYAIDNMSDEELVLKQLDEYVAAGTPCVIKRNGTESELTFKAEKLRVQTAISDQNVGDMTFRGTYTTKEVNSGYVISKDCFWNVAELMSSKHVKGAKVSPFRAWLDGNAASGPARLAMRIDGSTTGINTPDALDVLNDAEAEYYDLSGKRLHEPQKGVNIVRMKSGKSKRSIIK